MSSASDRSPSPSSNHDAGDILVPEVYADQVHASRKDETLNRAVENFVRPFVDTSAERRQPLVIALFLGHNVSVSKDGQLTGFVAAVRGKAQAEPLLRDGRLGFGTTWLKLKNVDEGALKDLHASNTEPAFTPGESASGASVFVVRRTDDHELQHYLVCEGNDLAASKAVHAAASESNATVEDVLKKNSAIKSLYAKAFGKGQEWRKGVALRVAKKYGLTIDTSSPAGDIDKHGFQHSAVLTKRNDDEDVYLYYNDSVDTNEAQDGVMVFRGAIAGYAHHTGSEHTVKGRRSVSWDSSTKSRPFSMFHTSTGLYLGGSSNRVPGKSAATSAAMNKAVKERIRWFGPVSSWNPATEAAYHSPTDADLIAVQSELGAAPGGPVEYSSLITIVGEIEGIDTTHNSLSELVRVLDKSNEPELPVSITGAVAQGIVRNWASVRKSCAAKTLGEVFSSEDPDAGTVLLKDDVIRALAAAEPSL